LNFCTYANEAPKPTILNMCDAHVTSSSVLLCKCRPAIEYHMGRKQTVRCWHQLLITEIRNVQMLCYVGAEGTGCIRKYSGRTTMRSVPGKGKSFFYTWQHTDRMLSIAYFMPILQTQGGLGVLYSI
jgi:hypothetical protein